MARTIAKTHRILSESEFSEFKNLISAALRYFVSEFSIRIMELKSVILWILKFC